MKSESPVPVVQLSVKSLWLSKCKLCFATSFSFTILPVVCYRALIDVQFVKEAPELQWCFKKKIKMHAHMFSSILDIKFLKYLSYVLDKKKLNDNFQMVKICSSTNSTGLIQYLEDR